MSAHDGGVAHVRERYTSNAEGYARWWSPVIKPMAAPLFGELPIGDARCVLDVGCGIGAITDVLRATAPAAQIAGFDFAEGMLRVARGRASLACAAADARALPVKTGVADAAVAVFMLHHVPEPERAVDEVVRCLRPGGAFGAATWGPLRDEGALEALQRALDDAGAPAGPAFADSSDRLDSPAKMAALLEAAGLTDLRIWSASLVHRWDPDRFIDTYTQYGRTKARLAALEETARERVIDDVRRRLDRTPDAYVWRPQVIYSVGRRSINPRARAPESPPRASR